MEDKNIQNLKIIVSPNEMKAVAANLINVEYNNSYVILSFIQTYAVTSDEENQTPTRNGVVTARVMLSWEHFARFYSNTADFFKATKDKAGKFSKSAFDFVDNMTVTVVDDNDA